MKKYYKSGKEIKVGHIVKVITGRAQGNMEGTITRVLKVYRDDTRLADETRSNLIICENIHDIESDRITPTLASAFVKNNSNSLFEFIDDIEEATPEEKKIYWKNPLLTLDTDLKFFLQERQLLAKFCNNVLLLEEDIYNKEPIDTIATGFIWGDSPEGDEYWRNVSEVFHSEVKSKHV